jgi:hypothetical protein
VKFAKAHPRSGSPARARKGGAAANWAFYRKKLHLYMPLNTAWMRFRSRCVNNGAPR